MGSRERRCVAWSDNAEHMLPMPMPDATRQHRPSAALRPIPALVVCAGLPRSGSTWLYNAARLILERSGDGAVLGAWIDDLDPASDDARAARHIVVKTHAHDPDLAARADAVLMSHRDLPEIAASMRRVGFVDRDEEALDAIDAALAHAEAWERDARVRIGYDEIVSRPRAAVALIARALGVDLAEDDAASIARDIPREAPGGADAYDPVTLLHPNHTGGAPAPRISARCADALTTRHHAWRRRHGYA